MEPYRHAILAGVLQDLQRRELLHYVGCVRLWLRGIRLLRESPGSGDHGHIHCCQHNGGTTEEYHGRIEEPIDRDNDNSKDRDRDWIKLENLQSGEKYQFNAISLATGVGPV